MLPKGFTAVSAKAHILVLPLCWLCVGSNAAFRVLFFMYSLMDCVKKVLEIIFMTSTCVKEFVNKSNFLCFIPNVAKCYEKKVGRCEILYLTGGDIIHSMVL